MDQKKTFRGEMAASSPPDFRYEMEIEAEAGKLSEVIAFVEEHLEEFGCPMKLQMQISLAVEEVFINIASYAYAPSTGSCSLRLQLWRDPRCLEITFRDQGIPYDPLKKEDPDISLPAGEREIGGLGIFLTKKTMDRMSYEYRDGRNILTMWKDL